VGRALQQVGGEAAGAAAGVKNQSSPSGAAGGKTFFPNRPALRQAVVSEEFHSRAASERVMKVSEEPKSFERRMVGNSFGRAYGTAYLVAHLSRH